MNLRRRVIKEDIERMDSLGIEYMCFHPGSHVGGGIDFGIRKNSRCLNETIKGDENITVLLETMSGKGTEIGFDFEQLKRIIDGVNIMKNRSMLRYMSYFFSRI